MFGNEIYLIETERTTRGGQQSRQSSLIEKREKMTAAKKALETQDEGRDLYRKAA